MTMTRNTYAVLFVVVVGLLWLLLSGGASYVSYRYQFYPPDEQIIQALQQFHESLSICLNDVSRDKSKTYDLLKQTFRSEEPHVWKTPEVASLLEEDDKFFEAIKRYRHLLSVLDTDEYYDWIVVWNQDKNKYAIIAKPIKFLPMPYTIVTPRTGYLMDQSGTVITWNCYK